MARSKGRGNRTKDTSWEVVGKKYDNQVGERGHFYHRDVIFPRLMELMDLKRGDRVLDMGCGQGVLASYTGEGVEYVGIDASGSLIASAKRRYVKENFYFEVSKAESWKWKGEKFSHIAFVLSLQNMKAGDLALQRSIESLESGGSIFLIINHPCFRIPRQSGWGEAENKIQYRYVNRYLSDIEIPITMDPGRSGKKVTWSYHHPISWYINSLADNGVMTTRIEELTSSKRSQGKVAKMENRARAEIPMFMILAGKKF